ncbi:MAG TPA: M90 family metallopeptidase, partial [Pirellulales bacterium]|nr:M90 family metallopeptidase [Pirellulales bacterium]
MLFNWLRERRRRAILAEPFPDAWQAAIQRNVRLYSMLPAEEHADVRNYVHDFTAEKNWEGCGGLEMTDEIRATISAHVAILTLGFDEQYFSRVLSILVYPTSYIAPRVPFVREGLVLERDDAREGEAWYRGPVILSWADVLTDGRGERPGRNLVLHEFAHQLDMLNGASDGIPAIETNAELQRWKKVVGSSYRRLVRDCEAGRRPVLNCYGATSRTEFFAVATEAFFELPMELRA